MSCPLPDVRQPFSKQDTCVLLAMAVFGEARNQSLDAQIGVASVVRNRVRLNRNYWGGSSWSGVILRPFQFDCFRPDDPNLHKLFRPTSYEPSSVWDRCYLAAHSVYSLDVLDNTRGAVFYYSDPIQHAPMAWGQVEFTVRLDGLSFYRESPVAAERLVA